MPSFLKMCGGSDALAASSLAARRDAVWYHVAKAPSWFTGATGSIRGKPPFGSFAAAKAGLRALAQTMARDWGPKGIHIAHVIIDGGINGDMIHSRFPDFIKNKGEDGMLNVDAITDTYWHLYTQHPTAWSLEVDLRPYKEPF
jgi:NAD(P)-dependent dehydrogenase (short-subunit alcohol dehydrogenase family)